MRIRCWLNVPACAKQERRKAKRWGNRSRQHRRVRAKTNQNRSKIDAETTSRSEFVARCIKMGQTRPKRGPREAKRSPKIEFSSILASKTDPKRMARFC